MSARKISASRLRDYKGPRRSKPRLNAQKRERSALLDREDALLELLFRDDAERALIHAGMGMTREPMSVWVDSDQSWSATMLQPCELPPWEHASERLKIFIGFDTAMELGCCYAFNANISPMLVDRWQAEGSDLMVNVKQRLRRAMKKKGIMDMPICFIVEARTRTGKSRNKPHLHGVAMCNDPIEATALKVALEIAFGEGLDGKKLRRCAKVERGYVKPFERMGRLWWVSYITKNVGLYDGRLKHRRVYISRTFAQTAHMAWMVRRDDQLTRNRAS